VRLGSCEAGKLGGWEAGRRRKRNPGKGSSQLIADSRNQKRKIVGQDLQDRQDLSRSPDESGKSFATDGFRPCSLTLLAHLPAAAEVYRSVSFSWERLSASIVAAGKPLPQKKCQLTWRALSFLTHNSELVTCNFS
jgi:hypothetical protein